MNETRSRPRIGIRIARRTATAHLLSLAGKNTVRMVGVAEGSRRQSEGGCVRTLPVPECRLEKQRAENRVYGNRAMTNGIR
jgi:hypothetical protein